MHFHWQHLLLGEWVFGHLDEIWDHRRVKLVKLARNEHGRDSQQLELEDFDFLSLQEPVDQINRALDRLRRQLELNLHDDEPVN